MELLSDYFRQRESECIQDENSIRFVGWDQTINGPCSEMYKRLFSQETINIISSKVTELLWGLNLTNRPIKVTDRVISHVLSSVYQNPKSKIGDIYTRYIIQQSGTNDPGSSDQTVIDETINIIVDHIRNEYETIKNNESLTIWNSVYGDFNSQGLRQHPPIKVREKRPQPMMFNMNY